MSVTNGVISKTDPISINDIRKALGSSSADLGTLCVSSLVKPTSKYKPVKKNKIGNMTEADYKGLDYGYLYPSALTAQELCNFLAGISTASGKNLTRSGTGLVALKNGWYYQKPTGTSESPYRIEDFRGYDHNVDGDAMYFESYADINVAVPPALSRIPFSVYTQYGASQVLPWELGSMDNTGKVESQKRYFGIVVYKVGATITARSNPRYIVSGENDELMLESTSSVTAGEKLCKLFDGAGTYWIIPVMSTSKGASNDGTTASGATANQQAIFYPLPCDHQVCVATNKEEIVIPSATQHVVYTTTITARRVSRRITITLSLSGKLKKAGEPSGGASIAGFDIYYVVSARQGGNSYISTPTKIDATKSGTLINSATTATTILSGVTGISLDLLSAGFNMTDPVTLSVLCQINNDGVYWDLQNGSSDVTV